MCFNLARDCVLMLSNEPLRLADRLIGKSGSGESFHIYSSLTVHMISDFIRERRSTAFADVPVNAPYKPVGIYSLKWPGTAMRHQRTTIA